MLTRQLYLPVQQAHTLIAGAATRILVRKKPGDKAALSDEGWLVTDGPGHVLFAVGDRIAIACPDKGHVATLRLTRIIDAPVEVVRLGNENAAHYGYDSVADLWEDYAFRYDKATYRYWRSLKGLLSPIERTRMFHGLIRLRHPETWWGFTLHVVLESVNTHVQGVAS